MITACQALRRTSPWYGVSVRCGADTTWSALAPRVRHSGRGELADWALAADAAGLLCALPSSGETRGAPGAPPTLSGAVYTWQGGRWAAPAARERS